MKITQGRHWPLGASSDREGVNFAIFSAHATQIELCVFNASGNQEVARYQLPGRSGDIWHGYLPDAKPGLCYGYRVHGPYEPENGHRFNANKLLLDPYARCLQGELIYHDAIYGYKRQDKQQDLSFSTSDSAPYVPKCVVTPAVQRKSRADLFGSAKAGRPVTRRPLSDSVIYEAHVKGLTAQLTSIPSKKRGTYAALGTKKVLQYLRELGITSIELLPVQAFFDEDFLIRKSLRNYWGYQTLCFFVPTSRYAFSDDPVSEFQSMVDKIHKAGIEVLLDVVYNHTAEGNELGPTLCYRGIDNFSYYRLERNPRYYVNDSGTGNTLAVENPRVLQLVMDSLRYWVEDMKVDGFRFDLATILGREKHGFDRGAGFFDAITQDPGMANVRLIAEPWDIGPGGYQLGQYPKGWSEWNDQFRDTVRKFWNTESDILNDFAGKLLGSSAVFEWQRRDPSASINFITAHDGFTLRDVVTYAYKHNHANGENNQDGHGTNHSHNYGFEGETQDPSIIALRAKQQRNLLCTLFLSQGSPMLLAGDERNHTQKGNNNAYCQDNETTWINWQETPAVQELFHFTKKLIRLRKDQAVLRRGWYLHGQHQSLSTGLPDVSWLNSRAQLMEEADWHRPDENFVAIQLLGDAIPDHVESSPSDTLLLLFNGCKHNIAFSLYSDRLAGQHWQVLLDTAHPDADAKKVNSHVTIVDRSVMVLRLAG